MIDGRDFRDGVLLLLVIAFLVGGACTACGSWAVSHWRVRVERVERGGTDR